MIEPYVESGIRLIGDSLAPYLGNCDPTLNTGAVFICDDFEIRAYQWDDEKEEEPNFKCGDYQVTWYKHIGRITVSNRTMPADEWTQIMIKCLSAIAKHDSKERTK